MTRQEFQEKHVLITVIAYPTPSRKYHEANCVAGIDMQSHEWVRLWPVLYRDLLYWERFHKYEIVRVHARKSTQDSRPESWRPDCSRISTVGKLKADRGWSAKKRVVLPLADASMCEIARLQASTGKSLGLFKAKEVVDLLIEETSAEWDGRQKAALDQLHLFDRKKNRLERIPLNFRYHYYCSDANCDGHKQKLIDWEVCQLYRNLRDRGDDMPTIKQKIRDKFLTQLCGNDRDTYFFVGNQWLNPRGFLVLGVFWPPRA